MITKTTEKACDRVLDRAVKASIRLYREGQVDQADLLLLASALTCDAVLVQESLPNPTEETK